MHCFEFVRNNVNLTMVSLQNVSEALVLCAWYSCHVQSCDVIYGKYLFNTTSVSW
uniref:Uncharacterized protein n=1 Tax=Anguilla anguilla TaxID=7936 RepID=A0A0E9R1V7_ANGAN